MEEGRMVSILLLEEEYLHRKDAPDLKPKVALSQILSPQLVHDPLFHYWDVLGKIGTPGPWWPKEYTNIFNKLRFPAPCISSYSSSGMVQSDRVADKGVFKKIRDTKKFAVCNKQRIRCHYDSVQSTSMPWSLPFLWQIKLWKKSVYFGMHFYPL